MTRILDSKHLTSASALLGLVVACGANDPIRVGTPSSGGAADGPLFVVLSTVEAPEDRIGYFVTTDSLGSDATIDLGRGIEEPGGGRLYVEPGIGTFMIGGGSTPTITRYELTARSRAERCSPLRIMA